MIGESIEENNFVFTVEKLEGHRIAKVHVEQALEKDDEENGVHLSESSGGEE